MGICEIIVCGIVWTIAVVGLYDQIVMVDEVKRADRKRGMR